ncbi:MAG TPA: hypothetical protein VJL08_05560, partial [Dehalococcoidia bacterium]|nr:hypothetical protein [Dehalococcoidia bacterium]
MLSAADGGQLPEIRVPTSIDSDWLRTAVAGLFARNRVTRRERSGRELTYHAPSLGPFPGRYPHQWFWDSCAHAIALCHIDISLARQEVLSLLAAQDERGFIPHLTFNPARMRPLDQLVARLHPFPTHSPYLQPPALAQAVHAAQAKQPSREFLASVLPGLKAYYRYLSRTRDRAGDGLLEIVHSFESCKDRSREYDEVYGRRLGLGIRAVPMWVLVARQRSLGWDMERIFRSDIFRVKDLLFNCVYARNLSVLAQLCRDAGEDAEREEFAVQAVRTEAAILGRMYDPENG